MHEKLVYSKRILWLYLRHCPVALPVKSAMFSSPCTVDQYRDLRVADRQHLRKLLSIGMENVEIRSIETQSIETRQKLLPVSGMSI